MVAPFNWTPWAGSSSTGTCGLGVGLAAGLGVEVSVGDGLGVEVAIGDGLGVDEGMAVAARVGMSVGTAVLVSGM